MTIEARIAGAGKLELMNGQEVIEHVVENSMETVNFEGSRIWIVDDYEPFLIVNRGSKTKEMVIQGMTQRVSIGVGDNESPAVSINLLRNSSIDLELDSKKISFKHRL